MQNSAMDTDARGTGDTSDGAEFVLDDKMSRTRLCQVSLNHGARGRHSRFQAEFPESIYRVRPEGEPGTDLANISNLLDDDGFNAKPAQGYCSRKSANSRSDNCHPHVIKSNPDARAARCDIRAARGECFTKSFARI